MRVLTETIMQPRKVPDRHVKHSSNYITRGDGDEKFFIAYIGYALFLYTVYIYKVTGYILHIYTVYKVCFYNDAMNWKRFFGASWRVISGLLHLYTLYIALSLYIDIQSFVRHSMYVCNYASCIYIYVACGRRGRLRL